MRSVPSTSTSEGGGRTAKARIRDAAIECFAEYGVSGATARKVADLAGVSPALVIHHFGSMEGLRAACDEHIIGVIRDQKTSALSAGPSLDLLAAFRDSRTGHLGRYLARILTQESPEVDTLVDEVVADAEEYFRVGVESGTIKDTEDPFGRAALLALWQLGAIVLHRHMDRLMGVDLTDPDFTSNPDLVNYIGPVYEVLGEGFFTPEFKERLDEMLEPFRTAQKDSHERPPAPGGGDDSKGSV